MIRINKTKTPPLRLTNKGTLEHVRLENLYFSDPLNFSSIDGKLKVTDNIYNHSTVKDQLIKEQFDKCCFCQVDISTCFNGHVEHFRPKGGYLQDVDSNVLEKPGYFWLSCEWSNLLLICDKCNQRPNKGNKFPLKDNSKRSKPSLKDISKEEPLFIDPTKLNPLEHIKFIENLPKGITPEGIFTVKALSLDREKLNELRSEVFDTMKDLFIIMKEREGKEDFTALKTKFLNRLRKKVSKGHSFNGMFRSVYKEYLAEL